MTTLTEADTCRKYVLPRLYAASWTDDQISEQKSFTDGRIIVSGSKAVRRPQKRADYLLKYRRDFTLSVVEAKSVYKKPGDGLQQAKEYAQILGLRFAYSTNGHGIVEHDSLTGKDNDLETFPTPDELWCRLKAAENITPEVAERVLAPYYHLSGKTPRYYQEISINRAVQAILQGKKRVLLTLATGTGKTVIAFQISWKLWNSRWNRTGAYRRSRILYLADRNILDYTGSATRMFADPDFDGEPALVTEEEMNDQGETVGKPEVITEAEGEQVGEDGPVWEPPPGGGPGVEPRKYYVDKGSVEIAAHLVYELDPDGKQLRVIKFTDYTAEKVRNMYASAAALRSKWSNAEERATIIHALEERGISFSELAEAAKQPDADPFDLLCHVAFNAPLRTRRERAEMLRKEKTDFFDKYSPEARAVLNAMLEKYIEYGTAQFKMPDILKVPPISERGTIPQIASLFGGAEKLRAAVTEQTLLYAA